MVGEKSQQTYTLQKRSKEKNIYSWYLSFGSSQPSKNRQSDAQTRNDPGNYIGIQKKREWKFISLTQQSMNDF